MSLGRAGTGGAPGRQDLVGHDEGRMMPAELVARGLDLLGAERRAVGGRGALLVGRAEADHGPAGDQGRPRILLGGLDRSRNCRRIMAIHAHGMPVIGLEALDHIVRAGEVGRAVDRDAIVVEQHDQPAKLQVACQGAGLVADALHQAAIAGDRVGEVVDQLGAMARGQHAFGQRHADGIGDALAERPGGGLDAGGMAVFGVASGARAELPEVLDLVEGHVLVAGQVQQRIQQHRAMPG